MLELYGGTALSPFKTANLLVALQAVNPALKSIAARFVHFLEFDEISASDRQMLDVLVRYGADWPKDTGAGPVSCFVVPRPGTIWPWSSKASDILRNCRLAHPDRIERGIVDYLTRIKTANKERRLESMSKNNTPSREHGADDHDFRVVGVDASEEHLDAHELPGGRSAPAPRRTGRTPGCWPSWAGRCRRICAAGRLADSHRLTPRTAYHRSMARGRLVASDRPSLHPRSPFGASSTPPETPHQPTYGAFKCRLVHAL